MKKPILHSLTAAAIILLAAPASAQNAIPLTGDVFIAGKTPVDPPPNEPKNSHAYMTVKGSAALRLYRAMRGKEEKDACEEGNRIKRAGSLSCSLAKNGRDATCDFSLDLIKGALDSGRTC
jgi:hypothetical protein